MVLFEDVVVINGYEFAISFPIDPSIPIDRVEIKRIISEAVQSYLKANEVTVDQIDIRPKLSAQLFKDGTCFYEVDDLGVTVRVKA